MQTISQETSIDPGTRVRELLDLYNDPVASVAGLLCDRHPRMGVAYTVVEQDLSLQVLTYGELREGSERFAAALRRLGVGVGDRVATLMGKRAEQLIAIMGIWRLGAVHVPLFTAFAAPAIAFRLEASGARVVVCDQNQRGKLSGEAGDPWRIVVAGRPQEGGDACFAELLEAEQPGLAAAALGGDAAIVQMFTSGTTGTPKAVVIPTRMLAAIHAYMEFALGLGPDDVFWNAADPGWAYGLYYGVHGSWCLGVPSVWLNSGFSPELTYALLSKLRVTNFAAAPTVYRQLRAYSQPPPADLCLRRLSAAGEPLTPEINHWAERVLGVLVHDHYGQTEVGMLINNHHHPALRRPLKPGSMGQAMPGWSGGVLLPDRDELAPIGTVGRIGFELEASPLGTFAGYSGEPEKSVGKFTRDGRWYLTGDSGRLDEDGYFHFVSRDDDVIIMAGYRIGPFDVESVLLAHPAVSEAAVIAAPDPIRGELLEAYVVLSRSRAGTPELVEELQQLVRTGFAAHAYPRAVHFVAELPKTPSGKIQRYVLRQQRRAELGAVR
jgi:acetyl-CoA synthetase